MNPVDSERLFVGAEPDTALRRQLHELAATQPEVQGANWRPMDAVDLHLTLYFIGAVRVGPGSGPDRATIERDLAALCRVCGPAAASFERIEFWPHARPRLAAATLLPRPGLLALAECCQGLVREWHLPADRRPFRPHLTLMRGRALAAPVAARSCAVLPALRVDQLCLFRVRPGLSPRYERVWRGVLAGPSPASGS